MCFLTTSLALSLVALLPGTGKTLLARAIASNIDANFLKVVSSAIVDKYIGESARVIREMFGWVRGEGLMKGKTEEWASEVEVS